MEKKIKIHETAMVTATFRSMYPDLSKDKYAYLWASAGSKNHAEKYSNAVSNYEAHAHCLRNRFFYETISRLLIESKIELLINFGSGFSMYPYLLPESLIHIEIDLPEVVAYKEEVTQNWTEHGLLPLRNITFLASNFNEEKDPVLLDQIQEVKGKKPSFILLEGVLFFIGEEDTARLFQIFDEIQGPGEYLGSVSFRPSLEEKPVFQKLMTFVEGNLRKNQQFNYQTLEDNFYEGLKNYNLIKHRDTLALNQEYSPENYLNELEVLNEHMYILRKINS